MVLDSVLAQVGTAAYRQTSMVLSGPVPPLGLPLRYQLRRLIPTASHGLLLLSVLSANHCSRVFAPCSVRLRDLYSRDSWRVRSLRRCSRSAFVTSIAPMVVSPNWVRFAS